MNRKLRKLTRRMNCDSNKDPISVLAEKVSELTEVLTIFAENRLSQKTSDEMIDDIIDEISNEDQKHCYGPSSNEEYAAVSGKINNDSKANEEVQAIGDSIYSKYNANAPKNK